MYVLGTAGHVDHGKSTLVKALTGIDPDRLEEEKRREMTIDLGFAWMQLPGGRSVSLIDVPGHERFIKNMLAGVGGIDAVLLVIAADEGVMPQTVEHLHILDLLGLDHGLVVLSKIDIVDDEWLMLVEEDVRQRLRGSSLAGAPIIPVSARTGAGLQDLLRAIDALLDTTPARAGRGGRPRLPIDRVFTIGGFGTVVTGTLIDGPLAVGDEVEIQPAGLRSRVRGLQIHGTRTERALPGNRVALNLAGVSTDQLQRGDVVSVPGHLQPTVLVDVRLRLLADAPGPLEHHDLVDLFVGSAEAPCRAALLDSEQIAPGSEGWVQLRLERPVAVLRGDRCVIRRPSPSLTIGGGVIVDAHPPRHRRFRREVIAALETLAAGSPADLLRQALADGRPHEWAALASYGGLDEAAAKAALAELRAADEVLILPDDGTGLAPVATLISRHGFEMLLQRAKEALAAYHRQYPLRVGMQREELRNKLRLTQRQFNDLIAAAVAAQELAAEEATIRLPGHQPAPGEAQSRAIDRLLAAFRAQPLTPPSRAEWGDLNPELLAWLIDTGRLVRVSPEVCFLPETYQQLCEWVEQRLTTGEPLTLAEFRDRIGTTRKYAQAFLEHLDERKITRRVGEARVKW
ncbi:MAG: selenocysteine-specific translation factor [Herpetosiphonaceae bacterium]|nr:MAG: selenocysteine-specific translation factor [Herpetosiphonaceae bacterium]